MLNEKLEQARLQNAQKRRNLIVLLTVTGVVCVVVIAGLSLFFFSSSPPVEAPIALVDEEPVSYERLEEARNAFKEQLKVYENQTEPLIEAAYLQNWNQEAAFAIKHLKEKAISHFSDGAYTEALAFLDKLDNKAGQTLEERDQQFDTQLQQAQQFYVHSDVDQAQLHIGEALKINPDSQTAMLLKQQIAKLPEVLLLLEQIRVASIENNLEKEYTLLEQLQKIDPSRQETGGRLAEVGEQLKEVSFNKNISAASEAIEKKNLAQARAYVNRARAVLPERDEINIIQRQIVQLETEISFHTAVKSARQSIRKDEWKTAKKYFEKAVKLAPANEAVVKELAQVNYILNIKQSLTEYEQNPYRLANSQYRKKAEVHLTLASAVGKKSVSLTQQSQRVAALIQAMSQTKEVVVVSDNQTFVQVRGVGKVGKTMHKIIRLKPGSYTFEGFRDGYKTRVVKVLVPYDQSNVNVKVICDEPI